MRLSTKVRYGSRALVELYIIQKNSSPVINSVLAKKQNLSIKYLESLMAAMKKTGIVSSTRGCKGGYRLEKEASDITLYDIYKALEGELQLTPCMKNEVNCDLKLDCTTQQIWNQLNDKFIQAMKSFTLVEMANDYQRNENE